MKLEYNKGRLELTFEHEGKTHRLYAEFLKGKSGYRRIHGGGLKQDIARAVGLKKQKDELVVLDATAGLGKDAFVLACLGCKVILLERSPIIAQLLQDGLKRAEKEPDLKEIIQHRMHVVVQDARNFIQQDPSFTPPDVIYLDPMFPTRKKSALTKMEMRIIRDIVGTDDDACDLLELALRYAKKRVVVKRPIHASSLGNGKPNFVVLGSKNRYDVYLTGGQDKN